MSSIAIFFRHFPKWRLYLLFNVLFDLELFIFVNFFCSSLDTHLNSFVTVTLCLSSSVESPWQCKFAVGDSEKLPVWRLKLTLRYELAATKRFQDYKLLRSLFVTFRESQCTCCLITYSLKVLHLDFFWLVFV